MKSRQFPSVVTPLGVAAVLLIVAGCARPVDTFNLNFVAPTNTSTANMVVGGGTQAINFNSSASWTATTATPGVTITPSGGPGSSADQRLSVTVPANTTGAARTIRITISIPQSTISFDIVQAGS